MNFAKQKFVFRSSLITFHFFQPSRLQLCSSLRLGPFQSHHQAQIKKLRRLHFGINLDFDLILHHKTCVKCFFISNVYQQTKISLGLQTTFSGFVSVSRSTGRRSIFHPNSCSTSSSGPSPSPSKTCLCRASNPPSAPSGKKFKAMISKRSCNAT